MKDFGFKSGSMYGNHWLDKDTYIIFYDLADDVADDGSVLKSWLETEYHADEKRVVFIRILEDSVGNCENEDVKDILSKDTKLEITKDFERLLGKDFVI